MAKLTLKGLDAFLLDDGDKPLGDGSLKPELVTLEVADEHKLDLADLTITLGGKADLGVVNSLDDVKAKKGVPRDPVLGPTDSDNDVDDALELEPVLDTAAWLDDDRSWLRLRADATIKAKANQTLDDLGIGLSSDGTSGVTNYRIHPDSMLLKDAVEDGLGSFVSPFEFDDLLDMNVGDAVAYHAAGKLGGTLTLDWSDAIASELPRLTELIGSDETVSLEFKRGIEAKLSVTVEDSFFVVFARLDDGYRVAIKLTDGRELQAGFEAGFSAGLTSDPEEVAEQVVRSLFGRSLDRIDDILRGESQARFVAEIAERLGLEVSTPLPEIRREWRRFLTRLTEVLEDIAEARAVAAFKFEFSRITLNESLLRLKLDAERLEEHHDALVTGDLGHLLDEVRRGGAGLTLERFLNQTSITTRSSWGLSLGIGRLGFSGRDRREVKTVTRSDITGRRRLAFNGQRGYEGRSFNSEKAWNVTLTATMDTFQQEPTLEHHQFALAMTVRWKEASASNRRVDEVVDHAILWRALPESERAAATEKIRTAIENASDVEMTSELKLGHTAFEVVLDSLGDDTLDRMGMALGAAMPWRDDALGGSEFMRAAMYGELWARYLEDRELDYREMARLAEQRATWLGHHDLGRYETRDPRQWGTLGGVIYLNSTSREGGRSPRTRVRDFERGFRELARRNRAGGDPSSLHDSFELAAPLWAQSYGMRAVGSMLVETLRRHSPTVKRECNRVLTVRYKTRGGQERELIYGQS